MHLVELTIGNQACHINVDQIAYVLWNPDDKTMIGFSGSEENYLIVNGPIKEVVDKIKSERIRHLLELDALTAK